MHAYMHAIMKEIEEIEEIEEGRDVPASRADAEVLPSAVADIQHIQVMSFLQILLL